MTTKQARRWSGSALRPDRAGRAVVLIDDAGRISDLGRPRLLDRMLARSRGFSLDARLAAGASPDADRLTALRAQALVRPASRRRLARDWGRLLCRAGQHPTPGVRIPLRRDQIVAAGSDILELQRSLQAALPVAARGAAMARHLLTDATGPVYSRRAPVRLQSALREAIDQLDPSAPLLPDRMRLG
jgi:hypothetical protein